MSWHSPHRSRWQMSAGILLAWTLAGLLLGTQAWVAHSVRGDPVALGQSMLIWLAWSYVWAVLTPLVLYLWRRFPFGRKPLWLVVSLHVSASVLVAILDLATYALLAPLVGALSVGVNWWATFSKLFGTTLLLTIPVYWLIVAIAQSVQMRRTHREREKQELQLRAELGEARLQALRAQLQPHFLFNAMNSIAVLMREDVKLAHQVLLQLSRLLRRALEKAEQQFVPLREEIAFLECYLDIEKIRFQDRLEFKIDVDPDLWEQRLPSLILQPLVENAVKHGLAERQNQGQITVSVQAEGDCLRLCVLDNGCGLRDHRHEGVGLSNTRARLNLLYGERASLQIQTMPVGGTLVCLLLPMRTQAMFPIEDESLS